MITMTQMTDRPVEEPPVGGEGITRATLGDDNARLPSSRKQALSLGVKKYFTGRPCAHGHKSARYTKSGNCHACYNTTHRELGRRQYAKHSAKIIPKRVQDRYIKNEKSRSVASRARKEWGAQEIALVLEREGGGKYRYTNTELQRMLGRSLRAIERARHKFRKTEPGESGGKILAQELEQ